MQEFFPVCTGELFVKLLNSVDGWFPVAFSLWLIGWRGFHTFLLLCYELFHPFEVPSKAIGIVTRSARMREFDGSPLPLDLFVFTFNFDHLKSPCSTLPERAEIFFPITLSKLSRTDISLSWSSFWLWAITILFPFLLTLWIDLIQLAWRYYSFTTWPSNYLSSSGFSSSCWHFFWYIFVLLCCLLVSLTLVRMPLVSFFLVEIWTSLKISLSNLSLNSRIYCVSYLSTLGNDCSSLSLLIS